MAYMKKLLGESMNDNNHSTLGKSKYNWDQAQYAELHKHHLDKAQQHRSLAAMHSAANVQNLNSIPKVSKDVIKNNIALNVHHSKLADAHTAAAQAMAELTKVHVDSPPVIGIHK